MKQKDHSVPLKKIIFTWCRRVVNARFYDVNRNEKHLLLIALTPTFF